ncbi:MAG: excalibur calcium-binding domain-containing protein [Frankiales bacterium]|nr:excalibur calcium-binding domain-containing protein [Frankiales bacterium]
MLVAPAAEAAVSYRNCTELQKTYPHGVGQAGASDRTGSGKPVTTWKRDTAAYNKAVRANAGLDRDKDKVACEKR